MFYLAIGGTKILDIMSKEAKSTKGMLWALKSKMFYIYFKLRVIGKHCKKDVGKPKNIAFEAMRGARRTSWVLK